MWEQFLRLLKKKPEPLVDFEDFDDFEEPIIRSPNVNVMINKKYDDSEAVFLASAHNVFTSDSFSRVTEFLADQQMQKGVIESPTWESVLFYRATIEGIRLVVEEFDRLEALYQEMHQRSEEFNKHDVI